MNCYRKQAVGFTLIEVLVALAIIGIALTAVIQATSQAICATDHLQNKMLAAWVSQQVVNEVRLGILALPNAPEVYEDTTAMLGRDWYWQAQQVKTPNARIKKIIVNVFGEQHDKASPLMTLESYVYLLNPL